MSDDRSLLGAILVRMGALTLAGLQTALDQQKESGERLGNLLLDAGAITNAQLDQALAKQAEMRG